MLLNARRIILDENNTELILLAIEDITHRRILEQQKEDLINMVSHELKTPLTSAKMFMQILSKQLKDDSQAQPLLVKIDDQIDKLNILVSEILDTTQIEQGKLELKREKFILKDEAREIIQDLQLITDHNLVFDWHTSEYLYADKARIRQVFTNFITNAIKYSQGKNDIIIRSRRSKDTIIVSVQDFGKGIPKAEQARIFDRFYQIHETNKNTQLSLGLGLYISKQIVTHLGGKIWVESEEGKGSTFFFSLPIYKKQK